MSSFEPLLHSLLTGNLNQVKAETRTLISSAVDPLDILNHGLIAGMAAVGIRFKKGEMFVPEVLMSARAMNAGIDLIRPFLSHKTMSSAGKIIIGTVKGDLHDIGKNIVAMMLESNGFTVINIGADISPEKFVQSAKEQKPDIIGISALLTTTIFYMKDTIELLKEEGVRLPVIVGGAPVTQEFADEIGADGFAPEASSAVDLCKKLLAE